MSTALALATLPLVSLYTRWCSLAKRTPSSLTSWNGCLWAAFTDPHNGDLASADLVSTALHAIGGACSPTYQETLAELAVRADQLQAVGDPRGEWLAIWLMPPSEHRDRAVIDSTPALAEHMERLIAEHERRARRTKTIPRKGPWAIEPGSTLVLRIDGGPDQVVTFRAGDFADTRQVIPLELAACIGEQLVGGYTVPTDDTVEIVSATYNGKVEIIGGSAALALGLTRSALHQARYLIDVPARHGITGIGDYLHGRTFDRLILDDVAHRMPNRHEPDDWYGIRTPQSVHNQVAAEPDEAALAKMREAFAAFATRRSPVSAEVLSAITDPSEPRRP
jgi:hypothetical protein